ncbi:hypothetical protein C7M84_012908 [Penaeus vannamei]|uniref:Uncharacterized protein n=1 Tax=Penaeus vannamei TaxID=6689 RepID=A0A423SXR2_PENVA|nr:hypothetical protein C7M84_012908 [Penaeus vannamei]
MTKSPTPMLVTNNTFQDVMTTREIAHLFPPSLRRWLLLRDVTLDLTARTHTHPPALPLSRPPAAHRPLLIRQALSRADAPHNASQRPRQPYRVARHYSRRIVGTIYESAVCRNKNETWEKSQSKAAAFLQRHFQLTPEFERVHRVGTLTRNAAPRDIVVRFTRYTDRDAVFQDRRKLANTRTGVYINEDLCRNSLEMRKAQMPALRAAKRDGKVAYFNYRKLVIKERQRSVRPREPSRQTAPSVPSAPSSPPASPFMQRAPHFPSDSAWGQQEPRTPTGPPPVHTATLFLECDTSVPPPEMPPLPRLVPPVPQTSTPHHFNRTSGAFLASTSVSVASNAMDASGATDADAPGATHDAAASIATDSSSSTMAAGAVGATTGGLPPRSSHTTSNQQTHKLGTTHDSNAGMALRSKPTGTRKKQL